MLLSECIEQYKLNMKVNNLSKATHEYYGRVLKLFLALLSDMPINEYNANHVRMFMAHEMERRNEHSGQPLSSITIFKEYAVIRAFSNWLEDQEIIRKAPTKFTRPPKVDLYLPEALTNEEIEKIFDYIDIRGCFRDKVLWEFFLDTGCRLSEVAGFNPG
jgi:site-specific recombinase XerC